MPVFVARDEIEGLADAGQHAERQHIDLHHPEPVEIVLVPFDEIAVVHRGGADGYDLVQPVTRQNETAHMLREMAGKADQLVGEQHRARDHHIAGSKLPCRTSLSLSIEPQLPHTPLARAAVTSSVRPNTLPTSRMALLGR